MASVLSAAGGVIIGVGASMCFSGGFQSKNGGAKTSGSIAISGASAVNGVWRMVRRSMAGALE